VLKTLISLCFSAFLGVMLAVGPAAATANSKKSQGITIRIDISSQTMLVNVNGWSYGRWKVSTARSGYHTPRGSFRPYLLKKMHYSRKYDNSPMPNSIFFLGGYAIHGTGYVKSLGRPASHGCVRLAPGNAAKLYDLIKKHGLGSARITIVD
jgi:lipoprotein-anchoring transpeptidase ErfK/SrfK